MRTIRAVLSVMLIVGSITSHASKLPLKISEIYSPNSIVEFNDQKLVLIDFWATWCAPCRPATEQLEVLQERVSEQVFMVSVTDESRTKIAKYIEKHPIRLMILRDYEGNLVKEFKVNKWPYAVLLTTDGELLWEGHPANLTYDKIQIFSKKLQKASEYQISDIFQAVEQTYEATAATLETSATELSVSQLFHPSEHMTQNKDMVNYIGSIPKLIAKLYKVPQQQVIANQWANTFVNLKCPARLWKSEPDSVFRYVSRKFNLKVTASKDVANVKMLEIRQPEKLWDTHQLNWGDQTSSNYLISSDRIKADNLSIADICVLLSDTKQELYQYSGIEIRPHDWDFHFRFDEFMKEELLDEFGITIRPVKREITLYNLN